MRVARSIALLLCMTGCGGGTAATSSTPEPMPTPPELAAQAAHDLECGEDEVAIEALGAPMARVSGGQSTHIARGCEREAAYSCAGGPCRLMGVRAATE